MACQTLQQLAAYLWICRSWSIINAIVLWGVGVELAYYKELFAMWLFFNAAVMTFFEMMFVFNFFCKECQHSDETASGVPRAWLWVSWLDCWRRGAIYIIFGAITFAKPNYWLCLIAASLQVVAGILYIVKTFRDRIHKKLKLEQDTYGRLEVGSQEIDVADQFSDDSGSLSPDGELQITDEAMTTEDKARILN